MCIFSKSYAAALIDIIFNKGIVTDSDITTARRIAAMIFNISMHSASSLTSYKI